MSVKALAWAWEQQIPANPKFVLLALADWWNPNEDSAWPSVAQLIAKTSLSRRTIQRAINWLVDHELVIVEQRSSKGRQVSNRYRLAMTVIIVQGCHSDAPRGVTLTQGGCHSDAPIEDTVKDTVSDTVNSAEAQEEPMVSIEDILADQGFSREDIFAKAKRKDGKLTPDGCAYIWRNCRKVAGNNGFQAEILVKEKSMLNNASKRVGDLFPHIVWSVMSDWVGFTSHAEEVAGAFNSPINPSIAYFVKFIEAAADFHEQGVSEDAGFKPVQTIAQKPLTKPNVTTENEDTAITSEELAAISKDLL